MGIRNWSRKRLLLVGGVAACAALAVVIVWSRMGGGRLYSAARREWKDGAIRAIERRVGVAGWAAAEAERVKAAASPERLAWGGWVGDEVLVMASGDWMVCRNICRKEDSRIEDLFIGRGSDGKWYYSTFHFCVGKEVLKMEGQPRSLAAFARGYWLAEFDGRSEECLRRTWEVGWVWGMEKLQGSGE